MHLNKKFSFSFVFLFLLFSLSFISVKAQVIDNPGLKSSILSITDMGKKLPVEKLYLQFDKPYYAVGDTIHFKCYLLNADYLSLSNHSGLLYIELDDKNNKSVKRMMTTIVSGNSWGDIALVEKDIPEGDYTIRAYTSWMLNFGEDYVYKKNFYFTSAIEQSMLVATAFKLSNNSVTATLKFSNLNKQPLSGQLQIQVTDENKTLYKTIATVAADGKTDINFNLPDKVDVKHLYVIATEASSGSSGRSAIIPVNVSRPENTDIKFAPEGGSLVAGLPARVGFKATGEDGKGIDITGTISNSKQQQVATFKSIHNGIGSFEFIPQPGESYAARIISPGITKNYALPPVNTSGTSLSVISKGDSLTLTLKANPGQLNNSYYLIGQARGVICYAVVVNFKTETVKKVIAKSLFPTGISRFTLLNSTNQPLNERMVYTNHQDGLKLSISGNKPGYTTRDSVNLNLQATDKNNKPVRGVFSVSVTDNGQVKADSTGNNLLNYLLLTSDIKDEVTDPGYYFSGNSTERNLALDDLLLTASPTGYSWKDIFDPKPRQPAYDAETEFNIQGRVTNFFNKASAKTDLILLSKKPLLVLTTQTDENGQFIFKGITPVDTPIYLIQAKNKSGDTKNVGIEVKEFKPPVFNAMTQRQAPWYVNSDTSLLNTTLEQVARRKEEAAGLRLRGRQLKEVNIKSTKIIGQSKNLNGPGSADQIVDKDELDKAGKMTLRQLLQEKIKGFTTGSVPYPPDNLGKRHPDDPKYRISYKLDDKELRFVFDGMDLDYFYYAPDITTGPPTGRRGGQRPAFNSLSEDWKRYMDTYLDYFTAEEIAGIEVMYNPAYSAAYTNKYLSLNEQISAGVSEKYAYVEITTRTGQGPFMKKIPGTYIYKPIGFAMTKRYNRPKYTARNIDNGVGTDLRSTIFWEPNIITTEGGKGKFSFYSADKPGSYTLLIEGIDFNGQPGYQQQKIRITPR